MIIVICLRSERKEILSGKGRAHFGRVIVGSLEKRYASIYGIVWGDKDFEV